MQKMQNRTYFQTRLRWMFMALMLLSGPVFSAIDEYQFNSDEDEARFKFLIAEMRCPKCLNINLAGSNAPIAVDLRNEIYDQIQEGRSNEEITQFMRARYGDFILYRPPLSASTALLWFGPALLLIAGFLIVIRMMKRSRQEQSTELSTEENEKLEKILEEGQDR